NGVSTAAAGANVTVTLTNTNGASYTQFDSVPLVLSGTTDASGHFQVTFTSNTAGQVIGNATATLTVSGVALTRATGDGQSAAPPPSGHGTPGCASPPPPPAASPSRPPHGGRCGRTAA